MTEAELPDGWEVTSLGRMTEQRHERVGDQRRAAPRVLTSTKHLGLVSSDDYFKGRQIYSANLSPYRVVESSWFAYATNHLAEGSIGLNEGDVGCVSPMYTVFSAANDVAPRYLWRVLKSPPVMRAYAVHEQASVDRRGAIRYRDFAKIVALRPPLQEQRRVAEILDTIDNAIALTERVIEKVVSTRSGLVDAGLDDLVMGSTMMPLSSGAEIGSGLALSSNRPVALPMTVPYLRVANVQDGYVDLSDLKNVTISRDDLARFALRAGDVLMNEGGDFDKLGRGAVWDGSISPCIHQNHVFRVRCAADCLIPKFLALYAASRRGKQYFIASSKQTTNLASINKAQLAAFPVPVVDVGRQRSIIALVEGAEGRLYAERARLEKLHHLRVGLLNDLLSGHVRTDLM